MKPARIGRIVGAVMFMYPALARAQVRPLANSIETAASASSVSNGYGNWSSVYARGIWEPSPRTLLIPEVALSREFHDSGTLFALAATQTLDENWYAFASTSTSAGGFYLPRFRGVALLNRKLLSGRQLVLNAGASYAQWKDAHSDVGISAGALYYLKAPVVLEVGTTRNISRPGNVTSQSYLATVTEGRAGSHFLVARVSGGHEAYAALSPGQAVTNFVSHAASLTLRQWVTSGAGIAVGAEHYANPFYHRFGLTLGGFWSIE